MVDPNWVSAAAALFAVVFSIIAHRSAERSRVRINELEERTSRLAEAQTTLAHHSWSDDYFREIIHWACQVCTAISEAIHIVGLNDDEQRRRTLISLSACIDMGRWYFPNGQDSKRGQSKEPAYRGDRQAILDWIVYAYDICSDEGRVKDPKARLTTCQRNFVSIIQSKIDPRSREVAIKKVLLEFGPVSRMPQVQSPPNDQP